MAVKKIGISRDLIIHPGETILEVLEERGITQADLAVRTGVTPAYVSSVIAGKKDISAKFALALEYALGVSKSFWMNLQTNYDVELMDYYEARTITEEERAVRESLKEIVKYLIKNGKMKSGETKDASILSLRRVLQISNLENLKNIVPNGVFRMEKQGADPYIIGAWLRMCQVFADYEAVDAAFDMDQMDSLIHEIKSLMVCGDGNPQKALKTVMAKYGIDFSVFRSFPGAPVQGYLSLKNNGTYRMVLTVSDRYADSFWFSLFHELGHIVNQDVGRSNRFLDGGGNEQKEMAADLFAMNRLMLSSEYRDFVRKNHFEIESIEEFARMQRILPYIVITRLQQEQHLPAGVYDERRSQYEWD